MFKLNTAVIGVGKMGRNHARVYSEISNLVAVCDLDEKVGEEIAVKHNCKYYKDYRVMLKENKIDVLSIAVQTNLHKKIAIDVIGHGVDLLIEKPIATTVQDALDIINAAEKNKVKLTVGHIERFNPAVIKLKEIIKNKELGEINTVMSRRVGIAGSSVTYENVILDLAIHDIDIFNYLLEKEPTKFYSFLGKSIHKDREDYADILLRYDNTNAFLQVNWLTPIKIRILNITGTKGYAELNFITQELKVYKNNYTTDYNDFGEFVVKFGYPSEEPIQVEKKEPLKLQLETFLNHIGGHGSGIMSPLDSLTALRVAVEILDKGER